MALTSWWCMRCLKGLNHWLTWWSIHNCWWLSFAFWNRLIASWRKLADSSINTIVVLPLWVRALPVSISSSISSMRIEMNSNKSWQVVKSSKESPIVVLTILNFSKKIYLLISHKILLFNINPFAIENRRKFSQY